MKKAFHGIAAPGGRREIARVFGEQSGEAGGREAEFVLVVAESLGEEREWRERAVDADVRELGGQLGHNLLDQEIPEGNIAKTLQAIVDGIKDGGIGLFGRENRSVHVEQGREIAAQPLRQRHFDENDRLARERGMKKREAAAVGLQAAAQVRPAVDFMHGFVADELFEDQRGGLPTDALETQESAIEPGSEKVLEVGVERVEIRAIGLHGEQMLPQSDQSLGAAGGRIDAAKQFLARRFDGVGKSFQAAGAWRALVFGRSKPDGGFVG